jgi:hypothetical protein
MTRVDYLLLSGAFFLAAAGTSFASYLFDPSPFTRYTAIVSLVAAVGAIALAAAFEMIERRGL